MKYTKWQYLYPPRPENAIPIVMLNFYEKSGWIAQFKKNGTNTIIGISPDKQFIAMTRHNSAHKAWQLTSHIKSELCRIFPEKKWYVLCAEILHSKTPSIKDTIYIYDMLVWKGEFMYNSTFNERAILLDTKLITQVDTNTHYICDEKCKIWYAKRFTKNFKELFQEISDPTIDEGLVLKNPEGRLSVCSNPKDNSFWQVKCRYPTKNYAF